MNLVWFRNDLRVDDNTALFNACQDTQQPVVAVYFVCIEQWQLHGIGNNQQRLTFTALKNLKAQLAQLNIPLLIIGSQYYSKIADQLLKICQFLSVENVYINSQAGVDELKRDRQVQNKLDDSVDIHQFNGDSLIEPKYLLNKSNLPYKVFTPYARSVREMLDNSAFFCEPVPEKKAAENLLAVNQARLFSSLVNITSFDLSSTEIRDDINEWQPKLPNIDEAFLRKQIIDFSVNHIHEYSETRDIPSVKGTSSLSAGLAIGAISVRRCYIEAKRLAPTSAAGWLNELIWRDFYRYVMWHFPKVSKKVAFKPVDNQLTWSKDQEALNLWKQGKTGVPIVDAAMKQLVETGWMHNRLRMIVASYLCKNLWQDWRLGEAFFAEHLFDYDFASNNGGWQWCASVGTDAAPYFRVFSPSSQQKRFDCDALFIKQWLPQLKAFTPKQLHNFESTPLNGYYPLQVDLKSSRKAAIESFKMISLYNI